MSTESDLLAVYRSYLACLNGRRWDELGGYVAEVLTYNRTRMTLADYRTMLEGDVRAIPDLHFDAELLLANDDVVACRLYFRCHPQHAFLGFEPTGEQVSFAEHVFYRFVDERIVEVWSVIDRQAILEQVTPQE